GENTNAFKFMAMALVKNHGLDPDKVPSFLVPDDLKDLFNKSKSNDPQEDEPDVNVDEPQEDELDFDSAVDQFDKALYAYEKGEDWAPDEGDAATDVDDEPDTQFDKKSDTDDVVLDPTSPKYNPPKI